RPQGCALLPAAETEVAHACPGEASSAEADDAAVLARLHEPRLMPFGERRGAGPSAAGTRADRPLSAARYPALQGYEVGFLSPPATRVAAVSVSHDVAPRGEVSAGGYWLHLSTDRGRTWGGPFYLGFGDQYPYVVHARSRGPVFDGERVNLGVDRREVDES